MRRTADNAIDMGSAQGVKWWRCVANPTTDMIPERLRQQSIGLHSAAKDSTVDLINLCYGALREQFIVCSWCWTSSARSHSVKRQRLERSQNQKSLWVFDFVMSGRAAEVQVGELLGAWQPSLTVMEHGELLSPNCGPSALSAQRMFVFALTSQVERSLSPSFVRLGEYLVSTRSSTAGDPLRPLHTLHLEPNDGTEALRLSVSFSAGHRVVVCVTVCRLRIRSLSKADLDQAHEQLQLQLQGQGQDLRAGMSRPSPPRSSPAMSDSSSVDSEEASTQVLLGPHGVPGVLVGRAWLTTPGSEGRDLSESILREWEVGCGWKAGTLTRAAEVPSWCMGDVRPPLCLLRFAGQEVLYPTSLVWKPLPVYVPSRVIERNLWCETLGPELGKALSVCTPWEILQQGRPCQFLEEEEEGAQIDAQVALWKQLSVFSDQGGWLATAQNSPFVPYSPHEFSPLVALSFASPEMFSLQSDSLDESNLLAGGTGLFSTPPPHAAAASFAYEAPKVPVHTEPQLAQVVEEGTLPPSMTGTKPMSPHTYQRVALRRPLAHSEPIKPSLSYRYNYAPSLLPATAHRHYRPDNTKDDCPPDHPAGYTVVETVGSLIPSSSQLDHKQLDSKVNSRRPIISSTRWRPSLDLSPLLSLYFGQESWSLPVTTGLTIANPLHTMMELTRSFVHKDLDSVNQDQRRTGFPITSSSLSKFLFRVLMEKSLFILDGLIPDDAPSGGLAAALAVNRIILNRFRQKQLTSWGVCNSSDDEMDRRLRCTLEPFVEPIAQALEPLAIRVEPAGVRSLLNRVDQFMQICDTKAESDVEPISLDPPLVLVGFEGDAMAVTPASLMLWEKLSLQPLSGPKTLSYYVVCPGVSSLLSLALSFFREYSAVYEVCGLGSHKPEAVASDAMSLGSIFDPLSPSSTVQPDVVHPLQYLQQGLLPVFLSEPSRVYHGGDVVNPSPSASAPMHESHPYWSALSAVAKELRRRAKEARDVNALQPVVVYVCGSLGAEAGIQESAEWINLLSASLAQLQAVEGWKAPVVVQTLPAEVITRHLEGGAQSLTAYKELAFTVYRKLSTSSSSVVNHPSRLPHASRVTHPAYILHSPSDNTSAEYSLHCCYKWSYDRRSMTASWTDCKGQLFHAAVLSASGSDASCDPACTSSSSPPPPSSAVGVGVGSNSQADIQAFIALSSPLHPLDGDVMTVDCPGSILSSDSNNPFPTDTEDMLLTRLWESTLELIRECNSSLIRSRPPSSDPSSTVALPRCRLVLSSVAVFEPQEVAAWSRVMHKAVSAEGKLFTVGEYSVWSVSLVSLQFDHDLQWVQPTKSHETVRNGPDSSKDTSSGIPANLANKGKPYADSAQLLTRFSYCPSDLLTPVSLGTAHIVSSASSIWSTPLSLSAPLKVTLHQQFSFEHGDSGAPAGWRNLYQELVTGVAAENNALTVTAVLSSLVTVARQLYNLSWLNVTPSSSQRRSCLPFHAAFVCRLEQYIAGVASSCSSEDL
eukprot:GILJ01012673.1.p1 GENE.GILJ01012673.1~~GILJ01012673.1.p1  ORF type:complete len:1492 (-),score=225.42 GILJ01012673.1:40-4515(-)